MNQPDRYVQFVLPEGEKKVAYKPDTKLKNAGMFTFRSEDHTIGNLLRMQLHQDKNIVFAGYRIPHPLESKMVVMVQTDLNKAPEDAMSHALGDLASEFNTMLDSYNNAVTVARQNSGRGV